MRTISKCSRVWGITDSSAATTKRTASMPPAPASMLRTNRSCPGTSTNETRTPSHSACAKPRSIVMPAPLLLREAIGVDPGQGLHEGRLAVIDVAGRADEKALHGHRLSPSGASAAVIASAHAGPHRRGPEVRDEGGRQAPCRHVAPDARRAQEREDPGPAGADRRRDRERAAARRQAAPGLDRAVRPRRASGPRRRGDAGARDPRGATCRRGSPTPRSNRRSGASSSRRASRHRRTWGS